jgi:Cu/Ag efflux protein CusF
MKTTFLRYAAFFLVAIGVAFAQQQSGRALGVVQAIDASNGQITLRADDGTTFKIVPQSGARFVRVPPGETSLAKGTPITAADIDPGDRLLARGQVGDDKTTLTATLVVVMTKGDLAKKQEADRNEWQKRGVGGIVTAVDPGAGEVTINAPSAAGPKALVIVSGPKTVVRRYPPDTVKFADAKPAAVTDIKVGDQVRALGEKSSDGTRFTAEELVAGSFRNVAATISTVDPATNTLKVTDLTTKKPLLVHINTDSTMKKLPPEVAARMAARTSVATGGGAPPTGAPAPGGSGRPPAAAQGAPGGAGGPPGGGAPGGMHGGRSGDLQQALEHVPPIKIEDLKPGDAIIVTSTEGADPGQVTAITLLAGVEPILSAAPGSSQRASMLGSWNMDANMGGGMQ